MKRFLKIFVFLVLLAGWALAAASLHVVRTPGSLPGIGHLMVMPKADLGYRDTFVDTTRWTADDARSHHDLAMRLEAYYKSDTNRKLEQAEQMLKLLAETYVPGKGQAAPANATPSTQPAAHAEVRN